MEEISIVGLESGEECVSGARCNGRRYGGRSQETDTSQGDIVFGRSAELLRGDGGLRQLALLGP